MDKIPFEDGTLVKAGYVEIDGTKYETVQPEYTGKTPLSAYNLIKMQDNVENAINDGDLVRKIKISGASKQETREGNNLLPPMVETTNTYQGRTYTSNGKGALNTTGVATGSGAVAFNLEKEITLGEEKLYVHLLNNYATGAVGIRFLNGNTRVFEIVPTSANMITDIGTTYAGQTITAIQIYQNGSNNFDMTIQPMICTSNSSLEFEQYGASPSIEHEAPIESVGDNINLFDNQFRQGSYNLLNNKIRLFTTQNYKVEAGKTYTLATNLDFKTYKYSIGLAVSEFPEVAQSDLYYDSGWLEKAETTFTSEQDGYFGIGITRQNVSEIVPEDMKDFYFKLVEGTSTGAYSPYGQGSIEIKQSARNLANYTDEVTSSSIVNFDIGDVVKGKNYTIYIDLKGTLSFNLKYKLLNTTIKTIYNKTGIYVYNFTATETDILHFNGFSGNGYTGAKVMLLEGTYTTETIPPYEKYQGQTKALYTQQPFRAIGDVKDNFIKVDGINKEQHPIFRKIFDGTENWLYQDRGNGIYRFNILLDDAINLSGRNQVLSNYFAYKGSSEEEGNCFLTEKYIYFYSTISSVNDFKAKLTELYNAGTPVYVDYVLATPTLIPCTKEQVEVLSDISSAYGEGMTNIICNDEVEPVIEIVKETKETVQSENDKAISALMARVEELEKLVSEMQSVVAEEGA